MEPRIQYTKTSDGVSIAYATVGEGPPLVWAMHGLNSHVRLEWETLEQIYVPLLAHRKIVRFDARGSGLSDRGVDNLSLDGLVLDMEAVVERVGLRGFPVVGNARGGLVATAYTARHPERVSHLVLYDTFARGADFLAMPQIAALRDLAARDWEMYTETVGGVNFGWDRELARRFAHLVRESVTQDDVIRMYDVMADYDVADLLGNIETPTLVLRHAGLTNYNAEMAKELASSIPNARLLVSEGKFGERDDEVGAAIVEFLSEGEEDRPRAVSSPAAGDVHTILFTDVEGSTALTQRLGDAAAREVLREHEHVVRDCLREHGGSEVKTMGDGFMASFSSATKALECAIAIQRALASARPESIEGRAEPQPSAHASTGSARADSDVNTQPVRVRIGLNAGEPIAEDEDLFGTAVIAAARIAAQAKGGEILAANVVRELAAGKGFMFSGRGKTALRGFDDPVEVYEVRWRSSESSSAGTAGGAR